MKNSKSEFSNTKEAFEHMSDSELRRAFFLFKMLSYPSLVKLGPILSNISLKMRMPVRGLIKKTMFGQFCGGEDVNECERVVKELGRSRIGTILDFATEGCNAEPDFEMVKEEVKKTIELASNEKDVAYAVFKPSGLGRISLYEKRDSGKKLNSYERREYQAIVDRFEELCKCASDHGVPVLIDAEESWIQKSVDEIAQNMMILFNRNEPIVFNTIQLYRKDRLKFLKESLNRAKSNDYFLGCKLVRGAYLDKEGRRARAKGYANPIHECKEDTDKDFNSALEFCVKNVDRIAFISGTHNEESTHYLMKLISDQGLNPNDSRISFAQLLGMSDNLTYILAKRGFRVCKYVPYGELEKLIPYLSRRAEENSSIRGQTTRELKLITRELERRSRQK